MTATAATLTADAAQRHLSILGHFGPEDGDSLPEGTACVLLVGPVGADWAQISAAPEFSDGAGNPLDRWSRRVLDAWAARLGGHAFFPFDGPPWHPFQSWALRTGRTVASPIGFLCHVEQGLMVSFRGALALPWVPEGLDEALGGPAGDPCAACATQPCRTACPVEALSPEGYDVAACHAWLNQRTTPDCYAQGCAVRLACPLSAGADRSPDQSAFHMRSFHP